MMDQSLIRLGPGCLCLVLLLGCGGGAAMPRTFPAVGRVSYKEGGPVSGGLVQFGSLSDTTVTLAGEIQSDGTFTLKTLKAKQWADGAIPGTYRVFVVPGTDKAAEPVNLPDAQTVKEGENRFNLVIEKPRR
jgi:hypothetical protein